MKIKLGTKVKDTISGYEGVATACLEYLNGNVQYGISGSVDKDGKIPNIYWIDANQLTVID